MRTFRIIVLAVLLLLGGVWLLGPSEPFDRTNTFAEASLGDDLDGYLANREGTLSDIRPGAEKEIVWAGEIGVQTPLSIVYLHGFSATKHEIRPVPDNVAAALGANLYFTRLKGHGRTGAAMDEARAADWWAETAEAIAIGRKLGQRIILMGTSTGATLATLAVADPALSKDIVGYIGVSPNYRFFGAPMPVMMMPFGRQVLPLIAGAERSWDPYNEDQAKWWTTTYPMTATLPMAATVKELDTVDFAALTVPALLMFSDEDMVVDHTLTREIASQWGAGATIINVFPEDGEAPSKHLVMGDIISPSTTQSSADAMIDWIEGL